MPRLPKIPKLLDRKIYKTGQTRGADDDQIFQNRVGRNSTVLIPFKIWKEYINLLKKKHFENGYIILLSPKEYFTLTESQKINLSIVLGMNALIFYEERQDWNKWDPVQNKFSIPLNRNKPLGGHYVARIANTTSTQDERINEGYTDTGLKGAGIRLYEYADLETIQECRLQLESLFWCCIDSEEKMLKAGMNQNEIQERKEAIIKNAQTKGLFDEEKLKSNRTVNKNTELVCPLCLEPISAAGFLSRLPQATGRERHDLTVTEINLFHLEELSYGKFNHCPYNLGWGHHHCNVVCKDSGIESTLDWMRKVVKRN